MKAYNYDKFNDRNHGLNNKQIYIIKHLQSTLPTSAKGRGPFLHRADMDLHNEGLQLQN